MKRLIIAIALLLTLPAMRGPAQAAPGSAQLPAHRPIRFPDDAAMHPSAGTEWWYYVGHLADNAGHTYGFEVTFFKFSGLKRYMPAAGIDTVYRTDVAVTDETSHRFYHGITYVAAQPPDTIASTSELRLRAAAIDISTLGALSYHLHGLLPRGGVDLTVVSQRIPMLVHGGFQSWGSVYTYYYSLTHLHAAGTLTIAGRRIPVHGLAWMDHQWGGMSMSNARGWDWMEMQLSDHTDLSLANLHPLTVRDSRWTMALLPDDRQVYVPRAVITPLGHWRSPTTGIVYPSGWRVRVPALQLDVVVRPTVLDQEMLDPFGVFGYKVSYWEGSCTVTGTRAGHPVSGKSYTELTGYGMPPRGSHL